MQQNANGLMEPSPLIAALSQALVNRCKLATTFLGRKVWRRFLQSASEERSPRQSGLFVTSQNNCLFYTGAPLKTNIFLQRCAHQETIVLLVSAVYAPLCSPTCTQKKKN